MSIEMRAIHVERIGDPRRLTFGASRAGTRVQDLPTTTLRLPIDDPSEVAVLSWRWDVDPVSQQSRNASVAIAEAARRGVRYLLIDAVSIDQTLTGDALMRAVVEFSALYSRVPVFAAYDQPGLDKTQWTRIMRRPWILREARAFRANTNPIVYVGHVPNQGATDETDSIGFEHMLGRIWRSSFTHSILHVLCGQLGMYTVSDLRFIMPEHAELLTAALATMSRNDFLLTAAIVAQVPATDIRLNEEIDLTTIAFDRYTLVEAPGGSYDSNHTIYLDGRNVATWFSHYNLYQDQHRRKLEVDPDAERIIHQVLGRSEADFERYDARADERRRSLVISSEANDRTPTISIVLAEADT